MMTGQVLHKILLETVLEGDNLHDSAYEWDTLSTYERDALGTAATVLNDTFLAPLQGRIQELQEIYQNTMSLNSRIFDEQQQHIAALDKENERLKAKAEELEQENTDLEREILETDDDEPMMPSAAGVAMASTMIEQAARIDALEARIATLEQENVELETQITESAIQREDLEQEVAGLQEDADESMSLAFNVTMTAIQADKRIQALERENAAQAQEIDALKTLVEEMNQTLLYCHANMQPTTTQKGAK